MNIKPSSAFDAISAGVQEIVPAHVQSTFARHRGWFLAGGLALLAALVWYLFFLPPSPPPKPKAIPVTVAKVTIQDVPISITGIGAAQAWTSVTILAQVSGKLLSVNFVEGSMVQAGQVLAQIDPAPYRAALTVALGALKRDQALLMNARLDLSRYQALLAQNYLPGHGRIAHAEKSTFTVLSHFRRSCTEGGAGELPGFVLAIRPDGHGVSGRN